MKITYDGRVNAAYIYLKRQIGVAEVKKNYVCEQPGLDGEVILNLDEENRLIGIEILYASHHLPAELLKEAEVIG